MKKKLRSPLIILGVIILVSAVLLIINYLPKENIITDNQPPPSGNISGRTEPVLYEPRYSFYNFTDPNENAFTINIPENWEVSENSGLIRPYIDAGIMIQAASPQNQGFFYISPYGVYTVPNDLLTFAGFAEGSYYDPSGGIAQPMLVKRYTEAENFLSEYVQQLSIETEILEVVDRPDLINENLGPLITEQSAAEITYISNSGQNKVINKLIVYNYLIESSGMGIWAASLFGYSSPENL
ncbi:MAG: hypothetical protein AABX50_01775, partial [Nanoarchaeota archaeon]